MRRPEQAARIGIWIARLVVAGVFLYAGWEKIGVSERFAITVAQFTLLPAAWIVPFAFALPWAEFATGILLLIPRTTRLGALAAAGLLLVFLAALCWAWSQGLEADCGCFGEDVPALRGQIPTAILRDCGLLVLTALTAMAPRRFR